MKKSLKWLKSGVGAGRGHYSWYHRNKKKCKRNNLKNLSNLKEMEKFLETWNTKTESWRRWKSVPTSNKFLGKLFVRFLLFNVYVFVKIWGFPGGSDGKETCLWDTQIQPLGQEDPLEKEMATHSSILAWEIPWTEVPGGPQSMGCKESDMIEWLTVSLPLFGWILPVNYI